MARKVKVPGNNPGSFVARVVGCKVLEEDLFFSVVTGGIHICEPKDRSIVIKPEVERQDATGGGSRDEAEKVGIPGRGEATSSANRIDRLKTTNIWRKERSGFVIRDWAKFSFLEAQDARIREGEIRADSVTFVRVTKATNIPGTHNKTKVACHR
jgi:hypothetical protein